MTDLSGELALATRDLTQKICEMAREAATSMIDAAFRASGLWPGSTSLGATSPARPVAGSGRPRDPGRAGRAVRDSGRRATTSRGVKRPPADLRRLSGAFLSFVSAHPGLRIEQINKQMGSSTRELALPIRKLVASGEIRTKGEKRSTIYFSGAATKKSRSERIQARS